MSDSEIQEAQPSTKCIADCSKPTFEYRAVSIDDDTAAMIQRFLGEVEKEYRKTV